MCREFHENKTTDQAIRKGNWKAVRHSPDGPIELYDLKRDKIEKHSVAEQFPQIVKQMRTLFNETQTPHEIWPLKGL
ncbi:hypothetical protein JXQ31_16050 [candidate division KSB1 bacterium]|nr:hypothetical protein [candidate division KSB1 bacterium]